MEVTDYFPEDIRFNFSKLEKLGLNENPFIDSPDDRFFYFEDLTKSIYKNIFQFIDTRKGLMLITGNKGLGKTILAKRIFTVLLQENDIDVAYVVTGHVCSKFSAIQHIASAFPSMTIPEKRSYDGQVEAFKESINSAFENNHHVVLIMDDVEKNISFYLQVLVDLYNSSTNQKNIHTILFGQFEAIELIRKEPTVYSRIFQQATLNRYNVTRVVDFINFRVRVAGRLEPLIEESAITILDNYANGHPREIVQICSKALDLLLQEGGQVITNDLMIEAVDIIKKEGGDTHIYF